MNDVSCNVEGKQILMESGDGQVRGSSRDH
jgi:hypothetical protein